MLWFLLIPGSSSLNCLQVAVLCGHPEAAALIGHLTAEDEGVHMVSRRHQEVQRQRQLVVLKQRLYGRPVVSLEGGHEFEVTQTTNKQTKLNTKKKLKPQTKEWQNFR
jgi:hypothetical protein